MLRDTAVVGLVPRVLEVEGHVDCLVYAGSMRVVEIICHWDHRGARETPTEASGADLCKYSHKEGAICHLGVESLWVA